MRMNGAALRLFFGKLVALFGLAMMFQGQAHASDYGCKVLLCLANPAGPTAVSECVPPITQLWKDLAKFKPFPTCDMSGSSYAQQGTSYYDPCPANTTALSQGVYAIQGSQVPQNDWWWAQQQTLYTGIGSGDGLQPGNGDDYQPLPAKVCVGNKVGQVSYSKGSGDDYQWITADVYDKVVILDPQGSPRIIDVFIDNALYRRVRW